MTTTTGRFAIEYARFENLPPRGGPDIASSRGLSGEEFAAEPERNEALPVAEGGGCAAEEKAGHSLSPAVDRLQDPQEPLEYMGGATTDPQAHAAPRTAQAPDWRRRDRPKTRTSHDLSLPAPGVAEVRITAASPDVARTAAPALRSLFASTEQRSYPAGDTGTGTRLNLSIDISRPPDPDAALATEPPPQLVEGARQIWP
ncbi:hypothetical protein [Actinacidiphila rubida]|nr:hypothetical protein [Actinacidiphila rubida]